MTRLYLSILASMLLLSACGQKTERTPNTFVESSIGDARRLNPVIANDSASGTINDQVFTGLVKYDKDIKLDRRPRRKMDGLERRQDHHLPSPEGRKMARRR